MSNQQWTPDQECQRPADPAGQPWERASQDGRQLWAQAPAPPKPSPFDFGFKALSLPGAAGLIFLLGTIGLGLEWLFGVITILASGSDYILVSPISVLQAIVGGAGALLFKVLALRVLIEIGVAVTTLLARQKNGSSES